MGRKDLVAEKFAHRQFSYTGHASESGRNKKASCSGVHHIGRTTHTIKGYQDCVTAGNAKMERYEADAATRKSGREISIYKARNAIALSVIGVSTLH